MTSLTTTIDSNMIPTLPYRVSTITATGSLNEDYDQKTDEPFLDLDLFYDVLDIVSEEKREGVVYAEYGKKKSDTMCKGYCSKLDVHKRTTTQKTKRFDNQVTLVYRVNEEKFNNEINVKVFKNGIVQMTGIRYIDQGSQMIDKLIAVLQKAAVHHPNIVRHIDKLKNVNYRVQLINSDFPIGFWIKQEWLYKVFKSQYENECTFEPCIYPGVKILYFCNPSHQVKDGVCRCDKHCGEAKSSTKKKQDASSGAVMCRKITIAVFQSGKMIITGAQSYEQINEAYDFITSLLRRHQGDIEMKKAAIEPDAEVKDRKTFMINKKNIVIPENLLIAH